MKILISGAHLTPALAMIDFIQAKYPKQHQLVFVGRLYSQEKLGQKAIEKQEVTKRGIKFIPFQAVKFVNHSLWLKLQTLWQFPRTVRQAMTILQQEQIDVFLSFGSYLAVPFALAAKRLGIPVVTHEQTVVMGKANQLIAKVADRVAISHQATRAYLRRTDAVLTGNPVRARIFAKDLQPPTWLTKFDKPIVLVMGGNQGSFVINDVIQALLPQILTNYTLVHQCGRPNQLRDSAAQLADQRAALPTALQQRYFIQEWLAEEDLFWLYQHAVFAISRAGANAVMELMLAPLPAILVPLPGTYQNEQLANAQSMQRLGGALIIDQAHLSKQNLWDSMLHLSKAERQMRTALAKHRQPTQATAKLYELLVAVAGPAANTHRTTK